jgi:pyridoxal biosynthesis lyase PdxS
LGRRWNRLGAKSNAGDGDEWDAVAHARQVRKAIAKLMAERRARTDFLTTANPCAPRIAANIAKLPKLLRKD